MNWMCFTVFFLFCCEVVSPLDISSEKQSILPRHRRKATTTTGKATTVKANKGSTHSAPAGGTTPAPTPTRAGTKDEGGAPTKGEALAEPDGDSKPNVNIHYHYMVHFLQLMTGSPEGQGGGMIGGSPLGVAMRKATLNPKLKKRDLTSFSDIWVREKFTFNKPPTGRQRFDKTFGTTWHYTPKPGDWKCNRCQSPAVVTDPYHGFFTPITKYPTQVPIESFSL